MDQQTQAIFDEMIRHAAEQGNAEAEDRARFVKTFFTNPGFRQLVSDSVWNTLNPEAK